EKIKDVRGVKVLAHRVDNLERAQMRTLVDQLRDKLGSGVVVLGSAMDGKVALIVGVTKDLTGRIQAGKVIGPVAQRVGCKGRGKRCFRVSRGAENHCWEKSEGHPAAGCRYIGRGGTVFTSALIDSILCAAQRMRVPGRNRY